MKGLSAVVIFLYGAALLAVSFSPAALRAIGRAAETIAKAAA